MESERVRACRKSCNSDGFNDYTLWKTKVLFLGILFVRHLRGSNLVGSIITDPWPAVPNSDVPDFLFYFHCCGNSQPK